MPKLIDILSPLSTEWRRPVIKFNSEVVESPEVVVKPGSPLNLKCEGDGPVNWQTRLAKHRRYVSKGNVNVRTLKLFFALINSHRLFLLDLTRLFWTSSTSLRVVKKEGEDYLLPCLLTDPAATDFGLRMDNGTTVPPGMNFTIYWHQGILIHNLHPSFNADYVCTAKLNGVEKTSKIFSINVIQKLRFPPYVFLETDEYVRIVGEELMIYCTTHNPNFNYNVTWKYSTKSVCMSGENRLDIQSILTIHAVDLADTGNISCIGTNEAGVNSSTTYLLVVDNLTNLIINSLLIFLSLTERPVAVVRWENVTTLTCTSFGYPAPRIIWYQCFGIRSTCNENTTGQQMAISLQAATVEVQREEYGAVEVESVLTVGLSSQRMTVECVAFNIVGVSSDTFAMDVSDHLFTSTLTGAAGILAILLVLLVFLFYKYKQKPRYEIRWKIIEASDGNNYTFIDPTQLPYNEKWEFPRDKLKLGKILGAGAFGKVVEATAYGLGNEENVTRVAVKMLKASAHSDEREALMSELKILSHLGHHKNIVNLLGACTYGGPVLVITEYCSCGDLLNFLRQGETFLNFVTTTPDFTEKSIDYKNIYNQKSFIRSDSGISSESSSSYLEMRSSQLPNETGDWPLDIEDLQRFSFQVAQGLDFLASKNCIHRDVAARNVLLTDRRVAKICDFGLARDIMNDSSYVVKGNARLPVKWMAPESIFDCIYTVQSDVWSYGILLWEIFSLGKSPYPSMAVDSRFYKMVKRGYQMSQPDFAPTEIYMIMKMCWNLEPTQRPTFSKISQMIKRLLGDQHEQEQLIYQNVEQQVTEGEECGEPLCCDSPSDQTCDHEEEEVPLMKTNNYQFC
uniref:receptor protein-tyrosine kinase n=1 Tax=Mastacembelus armatus TaxID=205130 RepID=A0A7N8XSV5_9TELE